jgi:hypothetical protein
MELKISKDPLDMVMKRFIQSLQPANLPTHKTTNNPLNMFPMKNPRNLSIAALTALAMITVISSANAVYWNGSSSSDWATAANWTGGLPSVPGAGNAIINPGSPYTSPIVSTLGNTTDGQLYLSIGAGLQVVNGGSLTTSDFITGNWGNSLVADISGGSLTMTGILNLGAGGYDGKINISGGTVTANNLSINSAGGAGINLGSNGRFIAPSSNLGNINYWIANNNIKANSGLSGWSVNVDTVSSVGNVILTAVPEPSTYALIGLGAVALVIAARRKRTA